MNYISITYTIDWRLSFAHEYKWSKCGKCFNSKTNKQIKQVVKSGCIGYYIRGKFHTLTKLRKSLEKIPNEKTPF